MFEGTTCLITGGTGSWGHELARKLLPEQPREIRIFSRNEFAQVRMQVTFQNQPRLSFYIGDVRDAAALRNAMEGVDYVFHLAALKHVPICERQPLEALKTNVTGTQNVIQTSIEAGVKKVIDVSTDKAVDPLNFYGVTKAMGEKLILQANEVSRSTRFICIRGGNVLGTNGSVVPLFKEQIVRDKAVTLTDHRMTRFLLTVSDAIDLLLVAAKVAVGGETFVMKMAACRIQDLAEVLTKQMTADDVEFREIGMRPGEKLHEVLVSRYEAPNTMQYDSNYYVIVQSHHQQLLDHYQGLTRASFHEYSSSDNVMNHASIERMLRKGGFLP